MEHPIQGDPVSLDALKKGDLIFIQHPGQEPELAIFISNVRGRVLFQSFSEPMGRIYDFYFADGWMPAFFRATPPDYTNEQIEAFRASDWHKYLGSYTQSLRFMRERIGDQFFFEENSRGSLHDFVLGTLKSFSMRPSGDYTLTYQDASGRIRTCRGEDGEKPAIYDGPKLRRPHQYTANQLLGDVGSATLTAYGPNRGAEILRGHLGKSAVDRRIHAIKFRKNTMNRLKREENARRAAKNAAGGGGGGNNTTKGGARRTARFSAKRRRRYTKRR